MNRILMVSAAALMMGIAGQAYAQTAPDNVNPFSTSNPTGFPVAPNLTDGNKSDITQSGGTNGAYIDQAASSGPNVNKNSAVIKQYGTGNKVGSAAVSPATEPTAGVTQGGTTNTSYTTIDQGTSSASSDNNDATVSQIGSSNVSEAHIMQKGAGNNVADTHQDGSSNHSYSDITQTSTAGSATSAQGNKAHVYQGTDGVTSPSTSTGGHYWSSVSQGGDNNTATVKQYGTGLETSIVNQNGSNAIANVTQNGLGGDISSVTQNGVGGQTDVTQTGTLGNYSDVTQTNGTLVTVNQSGGAYNWSKVDQTGASTAYVKQH
jgi:hypothetical protein